MKRVPTFSVVVTAPRGIAHCHYLEEWQSELADQSAELIIADATEGPFERHDGPVRHHRFPGASLQQLLAYGVTEARGDWVLITEDHCRPLRALLASYRRAMENAPDADLFAGGVENFTSVSPWSWAIFAIGLGEFWCRATQPPRTASNANFLIRRSAIRADELTLRGGILNLTMARLLANGRFATCSDAAVDHVVHVDRRTVVDFEYQVTSEAIAEWRGSAATSTSVTADLWLSFKRFIGCAVLVPLRTSHKTQNTPLATLPDRLRVAYVCAAVASRLARDDLKRIACKLASPAFVH